jgi:hypothetical protein
MGKAGPGLRDARIFIGYGWFGNWWRAFLIKPGYDESFTMKAR